MSTATQVSETPRTDEVAAYRSPKYGHRANSQRWESLARTLERELAETQEAARLAVEIGRAASETADRYLADRDATIATLRAALESVLPIAQRHLTQSARYKALTATSAERRRRAIETVEQARAALAGGGQ